MLFADGATTATPEAQHAFAQQYLSALGISAFLLGNGLSLLPGLTSSLTPQLQTALFGTGENATSLFSALQGLPTTSEGFSSAASTAFNNAFQSLASPLSQFFALPTTSQTFALPTSNLAGPFGSEFSTFGNGFNSGFGTGFPGFGTAPTTADVNFGDGFTSIIARQNPLLGFNPPTLSGTGSLTGINGGVIAGLR